MDNNEMVAPVAPVVTEKSKSPAIGMIVCAILAIAGVGFGVYGMLKPSGNTSSEAPAFQSQDDAVAVDPTISLGEVRELLDKYTGFNYVVPNTIFGLGFSDQYKHIATLENFDYNDKIANQWEDENYITHTEYSFSYDELNEAYHELFGSETDLPKFEKFVCGYPYYEDGKYLWVIGGCGGAYPQQYLYDVLDFTQDDDSLTVKVAYISFVPEEGILESNGELKGFTINDGNIVKNVNLPTYNFVFEKSGDHYILADFEEL